MSIKNNKQNHGRVLPVSLGVIIRLLLALLILGTIIPTGSALIGDIANGVTSTVFFEEGYFRQPDIIQLSSNKYAAAYIGNQSMVMVRTFEILDNGTVNRSIDSLVLEQKSSSQPEIILLNGSTNIYAVVYGDNDSDGFVRTVNITSDGQIKGLVDAYEFDNVQGLYPEIMNIYANLYAIAYQGSGADGFVRTINISSNGTINKTSIDFLEFDTADCMSDPKITSVAGTIYAVAYESTGNDGFVKTFNITTAGQISNTVIDSYEFNNMTGMRPDIIQAGANIFAIAYRGLDDDGFVVTINVSNTGNITKIPVDILEFDTLYAYDTQIIQLPGISYAIAYRGDATDGFVRTVNITTAGNISNNYSDSLEFDALNGYEPRIIPVTGDVYSVVYSGDLYAGYIKSMNITVAGDTGVVLSSYTISQALGRTPSIINISNSVYAVAYTGPDTDGFIKTVNISANGSAYNIIDVYEFDNSSGLYPGIYNIAGSIFAIAYQGPSADGFVRTINISSNGTINKTSIDFLEFDTADCMSDPKLIHVTGETYAVAYESTGNDGFIKTFNITAAGQISNAVRDSYEFDNDTGTRPDIAEVGSGVFAISYTGNSNDGFVVTVNVSLNGSITKSRLDSLEFDINDTYESKIIPVNGSVFAIAYRGVAADGFIKTISVDANGSISDVEIDFLEFDTADGNEPDMIKMSGTAYAIVYRGTGNDGFVKTVNITGAGQIDNVVTDTLEFDALDAYNPVIVPVSDNMYAIAYATTVNYEGAIKTVNIISQDLFPTITLISPGNDSGDNGNLTVFSYNASDDLNISSCRLILNGMVNATNSSVVSNAVSEFQRPGLVAGEYDWRINCTDTGGNQNSSESRKITIIVRNQFSGSTTNFSAIDIHNISNLILERPDYGIINFTEPVNLSGGVDFDSYVGINKGSAIIDSSSAPMLNKSARITLYNLNLMKTPVLLRDGMPCDDCVLEGYNVNVTFNVTHFTNYTAAANAELIVWDETDLDRKEIGETIWFYANYTNRTSKEPINGSVVWCSISFNDSGTHNMTYNPDVLIYEYYRQFSDSGAYSYNVTCNGSSLEFEVLNLSDQAIIAPDAYGPRNNYNHYYARTKVNVSNSMPEILNISCNNGTGVTLTAGLTKGVDCIVRARDFNGGNTISSVNGTYTYSMNSSGDQDDNSVHYTNSSCTRISTDGYNSTWQCTFNLWYYASNGSWIVNISVTDDYPYTRRNSSSSSVLPLYAINVTPIIDFGSMAVGDYSPNMDVNVTNLGNIKINVSVFGYGGENRTTGAGLAMNCAYRNISISNERYSTDSSASYSLMTPLTGNPSIIQGLSLPKQILPTEQSTNTTYWALHVNATNNPSGLCNGTVIFSAENA